MRVLYAICSVFLCFLLFGTHGAAAEENLRCTIKLLEEESLEILCEDGTQKKYDNQFRLSALKKPVDVLPGVQVFARNSVDGKSAFVLIKGIQLELYDLHLTQKLGNCLDTCQRLMTIVWRNLETLGVTIPVAAVDSEVIIRDSTFTGFTATSLVGGTGFDPIRQASAAYVFCFQAST